MVFKKQKESNIINANSENIDEAVENVLTEEDSQMLEELSNEEPALDIEDTETGDTETGDTETDDEKSNSLSNFMVANKKFKIAIAILIVVLAVVCAWKIYDYFKPLEVVGDSITVEYGEAIPIEGSAYLDVNEKIAEELKVVIYTETGEKAEFKKDAEYEAIGNYIAEITYKEDVYTVDVIVADTTKPKFNDIDEITLEKGTDGEEINYNDVVEATDLSKVTIKFNDEEVKYNKVGEYILTATATDKYDNSRKKEITINVVKAEDITSAESSDDSSSSSSYIYIPSESNTSSGSSSSSSGSTSSSSGSSSSSNSSSSSSSGSSSSSSSGYVDTGSNNQANEDWSSANTTDRSEAAVRAEVAALNAAAEAQELEMGWEEGYAGRYYAYYSSLNDYWLVLAE